MPPEAVGFFSSLTVTHLETFIHSNRSLGFFYCTKQQLFIGFADVLWRPLRLQQNLYLHKLSHHSLKTCKQLHYCRDLDRSLGSKRSGDCAWNLSSIRRTQATILNRQPWALQSIYPEAIANDSIQSLPRFSVCFFGHVFFFFQDALGLYKWLLAQSEKLWVQTAEPWLLSLWYLDEPVRDEWGCFNPGPISFQCSRADPRGSSWNDGFSATWQECKPITPGIWPISPNAIFFLGCIAW